VIAQSQITQSTSPAMSVRFCAPPIHHPIVVGSVRRSQIDRAPEARFKHQENTEIARLLFACDELRVKSAGSVMLVHRNLPGIEMDTATIVNSDRKGQSIEIDLHRQRHALPPSTRASGPLDLKNSAAICSPSCVAIFARVGAQFRSLYRLPAVFPRVSSSQYVKVSGVEYMSITQ
jgi:hypothetical protein